jgi:hypothetical protein
MSEKKFEASTAASTAEFKAFLGGVKQLIDGEGDGINFAESNENEVSCPYEAFVKEYGLSKDVIKCLSVLRQRKSFWLDSIGFKWDGGNGLAGRMSVNIENFHQYVGMKKPEKRGGARVKKDGETYSEEYLQKKFRKSEIGRLLNQIEAALKSTELSGPDRDGFMRLFFNRIDKLRPEGTQDDKTKERIVNNLKEFLSFMGAKKPGTS